MLVPAIDFTAPWVPEAIACMPPPREKAGGRYATGLLLQLPVREVRFRCDSMPKIWPLQH
jgi:hypothetical protein